MVRGENEEIARAQCVEQVRQPAVEVLQAAVEVHGVVPVAPEHVGLDEVDEDHSVVELAEQPLGVRNALDVRLRRMRFVDVATGEDVADLADAVNLHARVADERKIVRPFRLEREVVSVRSALVVARLPDERPCDDAPDRVLAGEDLARDPTSLVQLFECDRLFVRRDLEHRVRRCVDDPLACLLVLLAELLDDLRPRRRLVAEHAVTGAMHEGVDHVFGETVRVGRERRRRQHAHQLPVTGRRVLALRPLDEPPGDGGRTRLRRAPFERLDIAEPERLEARQIQPSHRSRDVAEGVGSLVAVVRRVGQLARADGVQHDYARSGHAAILRREMLTVLGLIGIVLFCTSVIALAAGVTWLVVKLSPAKSAKPKPAEPTPDA